MKCLFLNFCCLTLVSTVPTHILAQSDSGIPEIVVVGNSPGPPLWQVRNGENILWIFADFNPLPKNMKWDSSRVARIIENADEYLEKPVVERSFGPIGLGISKTRRIARLQKQRMKIADDGELSDVLSAELYQKLIAVMEEFDLNHSLLKNKPLFAADVLLVNVIDQADLADSSFVNRELNNLRRSYKVPVTASEANLNFEEFVASMEEEIIAYTDDYGSACLEHRIELLKRLGEFKERAMDWYRRELPLAGFSQLNTNKACILGDGIYISKIRQEKSSQSNAKWMENAEAALSTNKNTFAVLSIFDLIYPEGLLDELREDGYDIIEPL